MAGFPGVRATCNDGRSTIMPIEFEGPSFLRGYHVSIPSACGWLLEQFDARSISLEDAVVGILSILYHLSTTTPSSFAEHIAQGNLLLATEAPTPLMLHAYVRSLPFRHSLPSRHLRCNGGNMTPQSYAGWYKEGDWLHDFAGAKFAKHGTLTYEVIH